VCERETERETDGDRETRHKMYELKKRQVNLLTSRAVTTAVGALKTVFDHVHLITVMLPELVC